MTLVCNAAPLLRGRIKKCWILGVVFRSGGRINNGRKRQRSPFFVARPRAQREAWSREKTMPSCPRGRANDHCTNKPDTYLFLVPHESPTIMTKELRHNKLPDCLC